jgi:hypothetical protein
MLEIKTDLSLGSKLSGFQLLIYSTTISIPDRMLLFKCLKKKKKTLKISSSVYSTQESIQWNLGLKYSHYAKNIFKISHWGSDRSPLEGW